MSSHDSSNSVTRLQEDCLALSDKSDSSCSSSLGDKAFRRSHYTAALNSEGIGNRVRIAGWVEDVRLLGSIVFITVRDITGIAQAVVKKKDVSENVFEMVRKMPRQSAVAIEGVLRESKAKEVEVEIQVEGLQILSEATHLLPIDPTGRMGSSLDAYLDGRALNLRNPSIASVFKIRHTVLQAIRGMLINEGFLEVNTSKIIGQAAEGGANLFSFDYFGKKAFLAQSPQLYKEELTLALDRVFEVAGYFRAEKSHTRRHLNEFISVDVEAAFADENDVMGICERMVLRVIEEVGKRHPRELQMLKHNLNVPKHPFQRLTYSEIVEELAGDGFPIEEGEDLTDSALRRLARKHPGFYFIVDWPINLKPFYIGRKNGLSRSFDLQHGYLELASGGMRVSDGKELRSRIIEAGLDPEDFSAHLKCYEWGMPPHSGWGFGLDRFMMVLTGRRNIREVVLYPRDEIRLVP